MIRAADDSVIDSGQGFEPDPALPLIALDRVEALPERGYGLAIISSVFFTMRAVRVKGRFALELCMPLIRANSGSSASGPVIAAPEPECR